MSVELKNAYACASNMVANVTTEPWKCGWSDVKGAVRVKHTSDFEDLL